MGSGGTNNERTKVKQWWQCCGGSERTKAPERNAMRTINEPNGMNNEQWAMREKNNGFEGRTYKGRGRMQQWRGRESRKADKILRTKWKM